MIHFEYMGKERDRVTAKMRQHHVGPWLEERLRQDLLDGQVLIGNKLFSAARLAACYGVDKMTANKVVQRLVCEGILRVQRGSGTYLNVPRVAGTAGILYYGRGAPVLPYALIVRELRLHLRKSGYACQLLGRDDDEAAPEDTCYGPSIGRVTAARCDLLVGVGIMNREYYERLCWLGVPVLAVDFAPGIDRVSSVTADSFNAGYSAARLLLQRGHRRLLFVPFFRGNPERQTLHRELDSYLHECGWRHALDAAGDGVTCHYLGADTKSDAVMQQRLSETLTGPQRATAVFGTGRLDALTGAIRQLKLKVPRDVSVVWSMWDDGEALVAGQEVTRFVLPWKDMARAAVGILGTLTSRTNGDTHNLVINGRFHEGATVKACRKVTERTGGSDVR